MLSIEIVVGCITTDLEKISIISLLKFFVYVASPASSRIKKMHYSFFKNRHESVGNNGCHYHMVYDTEEYILQDRKRTKSQIADISIDESLENLLERVENGEYKGKKVVLISGDKGFRSAVDDLRNYGVYVVFIKPGETDIYAPLISEAFSAKLLQCFNQDPNWQLVLKTK